ncbi:MAG: c-type cytochrome domain-containing protein [candidate division WOR-3 bacterium]
MGKVSLLIFGAVVFLFCPGKNKTAAPVMPPESSKPESVIGVPAKNSEPKTSVPVVSFSRDVLPVLRALAGDCHTADNLAGNYALDSYEAIMAGGSDSVPNVIPGKPDSSLLYIYLLKGHPFGKKPAPEQLAVIRNWILQGAKNN